MEYLSEEIKNNCRMGVISEAMWLNQQHLQSDQMRRDYTPLTVLLTLSRRCFLAATSKAPAP
jgi:hypothetical protein